MTRGANPARLIPGAIFWMIALLPTECLAQAADWESVGGWEAASHQQGYGYVALGPILRPAQVLAVPIRVSANYLYYAYDSSGTRVMVRSPGISLLSGLRVHGRKATGDLLAGVEVRRDHRSLDSPGSPASEETIPGVETMADADIDLAERWNSYLLLDYTGADRYWYGSGDLKYQLTNLEWSGPTVYFVGANVVREGNDESDEFDLGGFVERGIVRTNLSIGLNAGYQSAGSPGEARQAGGFVGVNLYRRF